MDLTKLLEKAVSAPSGDNCQPWKFHVTDDQLRLFNLPERDTSVYNHGQKASYTAHGALLENLSIAAAQEGLSASISLFPDNGNPDHVATVRFAPGNPSDQPYYPFLERRTTNRRRFRKVPLQPHHERSLLDAGNDRALGRVSLHSSFPEPSSAHAAIVAAMALNDRTVFENPRLHAFLFEHLRWSKKEAEETRDGMDIATLELAPMDRLAFRILRRWNAVKIMNRFGLSRMIGLKARQQALSASAVGLIAIPGRRPEHYVNGGRLLQRLWLEATRQGMSFHLMGGAAMLLQMANAGECDRLTSEQSGRLLAADQRVRKECGIAETEALLATFRVGYSPPPSARSLRRPPWVEPSR
ncbi:MAG: nitroreductase [Oligoflexia bacterium]|nr:nitroreductase [Oligoflexia bacterium]